MSIDSQISHQEVRRDDTNSHPPENAPDAELLAWIKTLPNPFTKEVSGGQRKEIERESFFLAESDYGIIDSTTKSVKYLGTGDMSNCVALALHHPESKTSALAHYTIFSSPEDDLKTIIDDLFPNQDSKNPSQLRAHLRGGVEWEMGNHPSPLIVVLVRELLKQGVRIEGAEMFKPDEFNTFTIDAEGKLFPLNIMMGFPSDFGPDDRELGVLYKTFDERSEE